jgi:hypothetical protein
MHISYLSLAVFTLGAAAAPSFPKPDGDPFAGSFPYLPSGSSAVSDEDDGMSNPVPAYMAAMEAVESVKYGSHNAPQPTSHVPQYVAPQMQQASPTPKPQPPAPKAKPETEQTVPLPDPVANDPVPKDPIPAIPAAPVAPAPKSSHHTKPDYASSAAAEAVGEATAEAIPTSEAVQAAPEPTSQAPVTVKPVTPSSSMGLVPSSSHARPTPTSAMSSFVSKPSPMPTHRPTHSMTVHEGHTSSSKSHESPSSFATPSASATPSSEEDPKDPLSMLSGLPLVGPLLGLIGG